MKTEPKSIAEQIDCLARLTGAPQSFVSQVRQLFFRKGIPLEADATPYLQALEEAFVREEQIRTSTRRARARLGATPDEFQRVGRSFVRQHGDSPHSVDPAPTDRDPSWLGSGRGRTVVLRQHNEDPPMVPGPSEPQ